MTEAVDIPVSVKLSYEASNFNGFTSSLEEAGVSGVTGHRRPKGADGRGPGAPPGADAHLRRIQRTVHPAHSAGDHCHPKADDRVSHLRLRRDQLRPRCPGIYHAGAQSVQLASVLLRDSYEAIPRILGDLERWLEDHGYYSIEEVCGLALGSLQAFEELPPRPLTAHLTGGCDGCGKCVSSCLYGAMTMEAGKIVLDAARCTGCGMCEAICPGERAGARW